MVWTQRTPEGADLYVRVDSDCAGDLEKAELSALVHTGNVLTFVFGQGWRVDLSLHSRRRAESADWSADFNFFTMTGDPA